jgi:predicted RNase H-like HicB family nuclease
MKTSVQKYIEKMLERANYEYDKSVGMWAGSIAGVCGVYAQGTGVEEVRQELSELLEENLLLAIRDKKKVSGFVLEVAHA